MRQWSENPLVRRLVACLFGGFVLALMVGNQEGSQNDFGISFQKATATGRLLVFLALGLLTFLVLTFWPRIRPYLLQPGAGSVAIGLLLALIGMTLTRWYDPVGKFGSVSTAVSRSHGVPVLTSFFFSPLGWVMLLVGFLLSGAAVATRHAALGYAAVAVGIVEAVIVFVAHSELVSFAGGIDHTLGVFFTSAAYLGFALAGFVAARSTLEFGDPRGAVERVLEWRPGLVLVGVGLVSGLFAFISDSWFAPQVRNDDFAATKNDFHGTGISSIASSYLSWLGITLFVVTLIVAAVACYRGMRIAAWASIVLGVAGVLITFLTLDKITTTGAHVASQYGKTWQNLGAGGWLACIAFTFFTAAGVQASLAARRPAADPVPSRVDDITAGANDRSAITATVIPIAIAIALFYPPTLPLNWQNVVVTQIAAYLLLAVGLNVVVGWAGLLDLGYIAFYGIGSYTTAYFTNSLPLKPPSWLHLDPLWAIPFAVIACLIAGVLLGAPTLRLRGDYLAIVTLGFGEIIQLIAINNPGKISGGPIGPNVPHPTLHVGPVHVVWGLDNLPYWYLLLVLLLIVLILFYRLEGSRLGRAWAAIREDEVAAQATGIRTTRVKLLAFAVGASTSGIAGVFFGSTIGYFDPTNFTLQNSILIVAYVIFGGMGSLQGAVAGAAVLTWLPYFLQSQVPLQDSQMWIGALIIIMMIFRPAGLIPARRRKAELQRLDSSSEVSAVPASGAM